MQRPVPWMASQVAPDGHMPATPGLQMSAQWSGVDEPLVSTTHCGCAEAPAGAAGHGDEVEQAGAQYEPARPEIFTSSSSDGHGGAP